MICRFLHKISVFAIFTILLVAIIGYVADKGLMKSENYLYHRYTQLNKPIEADLLIVGNSRAGWHIDPLVLDSLLPLTSYNLGISGCSYEYSEVVWNIYQRQNKTLPKLIVCNVDFLWFGTYRLSANKKDYLPFLKDTCFNPILETFNLSFVDLYMPGMKYRDDINVLKSGLRNQFGFPEMESKRYIWRKGAMLFETNTMIGQILIAELCHFKPNRKNIEKFCRFLDQCLADNISVVLMKSPIHPTVYPDLTGIDESFALIDSISIANRLPLLDYTNYLIEDSTCFYDPVHLNYKGAQLLSVKLAEDIDSLYSICDQRIKLKL